jgi:uncharacterized protein YecE (DUF72 family)
MSTRFHIGAKALQGPIAAYAKRFDLLEVPIVVERQGHLHKATPAIDTLRRWRKQVPPHFDFSVVAGPALSRVKAGPELERELEAAIGAISALQARCVVVRTPPEVTPSALSRERLGKLLARFPRDATHVVWEPSGLWEVGDAAVAAKRFGVVLAVDAARDPVPAGQIAYVRLRALGETRSFGESTLDRIVQRIGARRDCYVVIETDTALAECKRLRRIAQRSKAAATGGMGRLVRPRGGIMVRDDEQE